MSAHPAVRPWPRLLSEADAADYLSIGATMFRGLGIKARRVGRRVLYDIRDLDRWVDRMEEQPIAAVDHLRESADEEERFFAEAGQWPQLSCATRTSPRGDTGGFDTS